MESATGNAHQIMMIPPPPGTFKDREELIAYVRDFGVNHGYVVTIKNSKRESDVTLGCDRGGIPRKRSKGEPKRKRKVPSRLINCPFEVVGRKDDDVWVLKIKNGQHNHEPLKDMSEHPYSRRFNEDEAKQIKEMIEAGAKTREVLETLKQSNPELKSTSRQVYNLKTKIRLGKFSETSFKSWNPITGASSNRINPLKVSNFIGGNFVASKGIVFSDVVNPATQEVVSQVPSATYEEFKSAVLAAKQAFRPWRNTPVSVRQRIMIKLSELIRRDIDQLALVISTEQGETIKRAQAGILHSLEVVENACGNRALHMGEFVPNASTGIDIHSIREPLGVCAGICQFNYPAVVPLWMFPIAVICGNTFVLKPSEKSPGALLKLVELAMEAGLPGGVLNIVHGGNDIVDYICGDDDIKAISFVGSHTTAMHIYAQAAARGKRVEANIRSKNQAVVMPDASTDTTLDALIAAGFGAAGDPCTSLRSVIFVGCAAPWVEELVKRAGELKVYVGSDESADMGPVISEEVKSRICTSVENAVEGGARLILDGRNIMVPIYERGSFVGPTILSGITPNEWFEEDLLGPVMLCTQVDSLEEAIAIVNQQKSKTGVSIFTTSGSAAKKFQNEVEVGLVGINVPVSIPLPFCSSGLSTSFVGNLNFYGKAGVQFYTQVKLVTQQWKGLTSKRISSTGTLTSEKTSIHQAVPMSMHLSSELSHHESFSSMSETSDTEMTDQERPVNVLPYHNSYPNAPRPTSEDVSVAICQAPDINLSLPQTSDWHETLPFTFQGNGDVLHGLERDISPVLAQTSEDTDTPASVSCMLPPTSKFGNESLHSYPPTATSRTLHISDGIPLVTRERGSMPAPSQENEDVRPLSQGFHSAIRLSSEESSMLASQGLDGFAIHFSGERECIPSVSQVQWDGIPSLMGNGFFGHSTYERGYIPMASQRVESLFQSGGTDNTDTPAGETSQNLK